MNILYTILNCTDDNSTVMMPHLSRLVADHTPFVSLFSTLFAVGCCDIVLIGHFPQDGFTLCSCGLPSHQLHCSHFPLLVRPGGFPLFYIAGSSHSVVPTSALLYHHRYAVTQPKAAMTGSTVDIDSSEETDINREWYRSKLTKKPKTRRGIQENHAFREASLCFCIAKTRLYGAPYWLTTSSLQSANRQSPIEKLGIPCRAILYSLLTQVRNLRGGIGSLDIPFSHYYLTNQGNILDTLL